MLPRIIGLAGRMRSGKDTLGAHLVERGYREVKFAAPLKAAVQELFGWGVEHTDGTLKDRVDAHWGVTPRKVMQFLGTECIMHKFPEIGVHDHAIRRAFQGIGPDDLVVITDVRFPREVEAIRARGGIVVRLERPSENLKNPSEHCSESLVDALSVHVSIVNDGTVDELFVRADRAIASL